MTNIEYHKKAAAAAKKKKDINVIDWEAIRLEYETTNISTSKLSKKYNLPHSTLKDRCYRHGWVNSKQEIQSLIDQKTLEMTVENIAKKRAKTIQNHFKISEVLLYNLGKSLQNPNELYTWVEKVKDGVNSEQLEQYIFQSINDKKMLNIINGFEKLQKSQRLTLGIKDNKDLQKELEISFKQWLETEKLKLVSSEEQEGNDIEHIENFLEATKTSKEELEKLFDDDEN